MEHDSFEFSEFRSIMDTWDKYLETDQKSIRINNILEGNDLILFFTKDGKIFGSQEESRLIFAKMKGKDKDLPLNASFAGYDLEKAMLGQEVMRLFSNKDLKSIKILSREDAAKILSTKEVKGSDPKLKNLDDTEDEMPGTIQIKDKKGS